MSARRFAIFICMSLFALPRARLFAGDAPDESDTRPVMFGAQEGWWLKADKKSARILHTSDGGKHWDDVSPPALPSIVKKMIAGKEEDFLEDVAALSALNARQAWVSLIPYDSDGVILEYTADAGRHWKETVTLVDSREASISFLDSRHGYMLTTNGDRISGVFNTENCGERWYFLSAPQTKELTSAGISFRSVTEGWITVAYDEDTSGAPLYRTTDGGATWKPQKLQFPAGYRDAWEDIAPPRFSDKNKNHGVLPVKLAPVGILPATWVNYETNDGGVTWHPPATSPAAQTGSAH